MFVGPSGLLIYQVPVSVLCLLQKVGDLSFFFIDLPSSLYSLETNFFFFFCQLYVLQVYSSGLSMAFRFPL